jgi:hypothetical protein
MCKNGHNFWNCLTMARVKIKLAFIVIKVQTFLIRLNVNLKIYEENIEEN